MLDRGGWLRCGYNAAMLCSCRGGCFGYHEGNCFDPSTMAKIHTHYDNLKVARKAPQEVIRAAYKALSQKYHPDKNPGDEKAARIMAILNTAYGTLSDPLRRREHDDWIAAEEWEIAWLESTQAEENRELLSHDAHQWQPEPSEPVPARGNGPWWVALAIGLLLGGGAGIVMMNQSKALPDAVAAVMGNAPVTVPLAPPPVAAPAPREEAPAETWAVAEAGTAEAGLAPEVKTLGVTQFKVPARAADCNTELHTLVAPNGEPWPRQSGYLDNAPVANQGNDMQIFVDNSANASPVLVKVNDLARRVTVRELYLMAGESITVDNLAAGRYEVKYQNIKVGGTREECLVRRKRGQAQDALVQSLP